MNMDTCKCLNILAGLVIILILFCIYWLNLAAKNAANITGPTVLAASQSYLAVDIGKVLYVLDRQGNILHEKKYADLGLPERMGKLQWFDGKLYLGNAITGSLYSCELVNWDCAVVKGFDQIARQVFGFYVDSEYIYIADTSRHELKIYDNKGRLISGSRGEPVPLCYPNQIMVQDSKLYIADTNNHRVVSLELPVSDAFLLSSVAKIGEVNTDWVHLYRRRSLPSWCAPISSNLTDDGDAYIERAIDFNEQHPLKSPSGVRQGRVWPTSFSFDPSGYIWLIVGDHDLADGDLLVYKNGKYDRRVNLTDEFDPLSIVNFSDRMIVSDQKTMNLVAFSYGGNDQGVFGSKEFNQKMQSLLADKKSLEKQVGIVQNIIAFLLLLAFCIAIFSKKKGC